MRKFVWYTLQEINIHPPDNAYLKMIFLFPRWDMLVPWRVVFFFVGGEVLEATSDDIRFWTMGGLKILKVEGWTLPRLEHLDVRPDALSTLGLLATEKGDHCYLLLGYL